MYINIFSMVRKENIELKNERDRLIGEMETQKQELNDHIKKLEQMCATQKAIEAKLEAKIEELMQQTVQTTVEQTGNTANIDDIVGDTLAVQQTGQTTVQKTGEKTKVPKVKPPLICDCGYDANFLTNC